VITTVVVLLFQRRSLHRGTGIGLLALYAGYDLYVVARGG
jgi:hypothetical protein